MFKNNNKIKLMIVVGTRPEIIRLAEVIKKCKKYFDTLLVHTGQNYDYNLSGVFFKDFELDEPDIYLNAAGDDAGGTMGNVIAKSYKIFSELKPDAVLVLGDTNSCLCVISAKRLKIPVFHMEAGNRCKDENLPEEIIRRIVDVTSDINLCYSENARRYILDAGARPEYTFVTGSPMAEVLSKNINKINASDILNNLNLEPRKYILLSAHREENIDIEINFFNLMNAINNLAGKYNMPVLYSCHPRSEKFLKLRNFKFNDLVIQHKPLGFFDYNKLQANAFCVVSDSGTLPEECAYFYSVNQGFPAVSVRTSSERPEAIDKGVLIIGSIDSNSVLQAVNLAVEMHANNDWPVKVPAYIDENVSAKVIKIIQAYTPIINKFIWRK